MKISSCWIVKLRNLRGIGNGGKGRFVKIDLTVSGGDGHDRTSSPKSAAITH